MDKDFFMGMLLGICGGALMAANSMKVRKAVKDGQEQVISAINKMEVKEKTAQQTSEKK